MGVLTMFTGPKAMPVTPQQEQAVDGAENWNSMKVRLVGAAQLPQYLEAWQRLAQSAVAPNPFYEPWALMPAVERLGEKESLHFFLVFGPQKKKKEMGPLWGFIPLAVHSKCLSLPIRTLAFWQHRYCALAVPLIDAGHVWETLDAFWRWFEGNPLDCHVLDTNYLPSEGPFHEIWADFAIGRSSLVLSEFPRCLQVRSESFDTYFSEFMSANHRRDNRRKERRLAELGSPAYRLVQDASQAGQWVEDFLQLEASGWKGGPDGGAFARNPEDAAYFREVIREGFLQSRVWLMSLVLDGKTIAMKSVFLAADGGFSFKIAYDESYSKYSPGMLLELQHLRWLFDDPQVKWSDTCAIPRHPMYVAISNDRRMIRRTLFSDGSRRGDFWAATLPMLRWLKRMLKPNSGPDYLRISTKESAEA